MGSPPSISKIHIVNLCKEVRQMDQDAFLKDQYTENT